jgi:hypothetical protein
MFKTKQAYWTPVTHACNPNYSGRDQEDRLSKPAQANRLRDPISGERKKENLRKKRLVEWLKM